MSLINQKRGGLALFGSPKHAASLRIRLVAYAKDLEIEHVEIDADNIPEDLLEINPTGRLPTLIDRDLVLFDERVIAEYLDERFPHPALMPIEANLRARIRLFCYEIEKHWYELADQLEHARLTAAKKKSTIKALREAVLYMAPLFKNKQYLIGNELSLLDCCVLPILWRLSYLGVELPNSAQGVQNYMNFHFAQDYFKRALSKYEQKMAHQS